METDTKYFSLSQPQKSIWYLEQKHPDTCMNVISGTLRLKGRIDYTVLEEAINLTIEKNDAMRTRIVEKDGDALQYFAPYKKIRIELFDFSRGEGQTGLFKWDDEQTKIPMKLYDSDLYYFALVKVNEEDGGIFGKQHHLISDAWTMSIVGNMIMSYYTSLTNGIQVSHDANPSFSEHLINEEKYEQSERFQGDMAYWNSKFEIYPEPTVLKSQALTTNEIKARRKTLLIPQKLSNKIREYCGANKASGFTLFLSALAIYIYRVTGNEDIILGTTITNRVNAREKDTPGMFVSVAAPIRIGINDSMDFQTFAEGMLKESVSVLRHQKYPYNYLVRDLKKKHKMPGRLFDIVLNYQNSKFTTKSATVDYSTRWHFTGYQVESLVIHVNDRDDEGTYILDYDYLADVYNVKEIEYIHQHVISLLWHALDNPVRNISRIEMLSEKEKHKILYDFNSTQADFPSEKTLHQIFEEQAEKTPDNTAVIFGDRRITYRELNEKSNQLAQELRRLGVTADSVVGISVYRSIEMVIGLMGILKAGGAYLPVDPDYPEDRIRYMLDDSGAKILLTQKPLMPQFAFFGNLLDLENDIDSTENANNPEPCSGPRNLAYVIYTSGSTGRPKGVMVEHRSVVNRLHWGCKKYPIHERSLILQKTPFTFDVSVYELFWWTFAGAALCVLQPEGEKDPEIIVREIAKHQITFVHFVPSMLGVFLNYVEKTESVEKLSSIERVYASGEALTVLQVDSFNRILNQSNGSELHNLYGPTEATVEVSYFDCSPECDLKSVPIGKPIDNIQLYILDKNMNISPIGIPGELYIGGVGVARGYINNPQLTSEKFSEDPFFAGAKMYRTGDRVRWFPKGDIEYLGRVDFQVKIRGFRIELGEIENRLMTIQEIKNAVVVGKQHSGNHYLCAYLLLHRDIKIRDIKELLAKDLPEYMIPSFFLVMDSLPFLSNGKINRNALPLPDFSSQIEEEVTDPENEIEKTISDIWCEILEVEKVSVTDSFFNMGGDSLHAITLITEMHRRLNFAMPVRDVFLLKTVRRMAEQIAQASSSQFLPIPQTAHHPFYDVSSAQRRLYILKQIEENDISYNLPAILLIEGAVSRMKVENVFRQLIKRHESLRTFFDVIDGKPVQRIMEDVPFEVGYAEADESEIQDIMRAFIRPFDLKTAPLLRAELIRTGNTRHFLLFDMHHIISDGTSINILIREFADLYHGTELSDLTMQYKDYSAWHAGQIASVAMKGKAEYWLDRFAGEIPILNLSTDFPRPTRKSYKGKRISLQIPEALANSIKRTATDTGATLFMVLLAAYHVLLSKYTSQDDIIVGIPVEGRMHADLQSAVGMFVNTLAIRSYPAGEKSFLQFLQEVKDDLLKAYDNQDYPFEELIDHVKPGRDLGRNPLFDTVFVLQHMDISQFGLHELTITPYKFDSRSAKFDITLEAFDRDGKIDLVAEYCTDLFEETTIQRMLGHFSNILKGIVDEPSQLISDIDLLSSDERNFLLTSCNDTDASFPGEKTLQQLFEEQCVKTPDRTAVIFEDHRMRYGELNGRANQLALFLRGKGVTSESVVGISLRRSMEMVVGILAILKAGGAYLPMDPDYPEDRIQYMLADSGAILLLTQSDLIRKWNTNVPVFDMNEPFIYSGEGSNLTGCSSAGNLAYIIYTSGSTGRPKGVMIEHRNVVRLLFNNRFQFQFSSGDVWTLFHSFCFDFSVWEMYGSLLSGASLVIIPKDVAKDSRKFLQVLKKEKVTVLNQTPAAFYNLIQEEMASPDHSLQLRYVIFGGEALKPVMLRPFHTLYPSAALINMYGITETTVHVTFKEIRTEEIDKNVSNIGRAIPTLRTYITDKNLHLMPVGVPGELCVSGGGVGRGYVNNEEFTRLKFVPSPFNIHETLYRSGDLAKVNRSGDLEYLGRIDSQVKIRGFRIELGEIESVLYQYPGMHEVVVFPKQSLLGEKKLYAYYVADKEIHQNDLRAFLQKQVPEYMVPAFFFQIGKMPLNRNGKIDRNSLQKIEVTVQLDVEYAEPENDLQAAITQIWMHVLEVPRVGIYDDFFRLGGDSLSAIKMMSLLAEIHCDITLIDIYNNSTVKKIADFISAGDTAHKNKILIRLSPACSAEPKTSIICFPYGGGNAIAYKALSDAVSKSSAEYTVYGVNIPGHDVGGSEELLSVTDASKKVFDEICETCSEDIILYGHCVGNAMLLETAHLLENADIRLNAIFAGAIFPPKYAGFYGNFIDPWMLHSDAKIISYLQQIGLPKTSLNNDYVGFILKTFRHDARSYYRYFYDYAIKDNPKIRAPFYCVVGEIDEITKNYHSKYRKWNLFAKMVHLRVLKGANHYFLNSHADELAGMITHHISEKGKIHAGESVHKSI